MGRLARIRLLARERFLGIDTRPRSTRRELVSFGWQLKSPGDLACACAPSDFLPATAYSLQPKEFLVSSSPQPPARPLLIALTGGIASGKTAVSDMFAALGVPVLDTDQIARDVVAPGMPTLLELVNTFGSEILDATGNLDRRRMRGRVFSNPDDRARLEAITHPAIREELAVRSARAGGPYQVHVIPLLVEGSRAGEYDRVLLVDCPKEDQIKRLVARDTITVEQACSMLAAQATRAQRLEVADDVIVNTGTIEDLQDFVRTLHKNYSKIATALNGAPPAEPTTRA